ncbi:MAG: extracellular solute-binding protein [Chloroflexi bacterium]|nr:extracellular solute-binding protein [Chloroflexota bacterium]
MKRSTLLLAIALLPIMLYAGCAPAVPASPAAEKAAPASGQSTAAPKTGWEQKWNSTLAEARKEGVVTIYSQWGPEIRTQLTSAFKGKYGLDLEFASFSRANEVLARLLAERGAGLHIPDFVGAGTGTATTDMKPAGLLGPIDQLIILPEVTDPKAWKDGKLPFVDQDKQVIAMSANIGRTVMYNTDLVKKGEIVSYKDLLKPQYKGKITLNDPTIGGQGTSFVAFLAKRLWTLPEANDFLTQLIQQQDLSIQRDQRLLVETVARGKFAIGLAPAPANLAEFLRAAAPVDVAAVKEGTFVQSGGGGFSIAARLVHPNAARVFVNWLLTREGQTVFARSFGSPSLRTDVPTEGIHPILLPQPGETLFLDDEEMIHFRTEQMVNIAKDVIDKAMRK